MYVYMYIHIEDEHDGGGVDRKWCEPPRKKKLSSSLPVLPCARHSNVKRNGVCVSHGLLVDWPAVNRVGRASSRRQVELRIARDQGGAGEGRPEDTGGGTLNPFFPSPGRAPDCERSRGSGRGQA